MLDCGTRGKSPRFGNIKLLFGVANMILGSESLVDASM